MTKKAILLTYIFILLSVGYAKADGSRPLYWAQPVTNLGLTNIYKIDEGVYRCEQPDKNDFKTLQEFGIKEVLNLREWHNDKRKARGTDIEVHHVRMAAHNITDYDVIEALRVIKNRKGDILIHCRHGSDRTGLISAMYRIIFQDWTKEEAINELRNGGYGYHRIYFNIPAYINNTDVNKIKESVRNKTN